MAQRAAEQRDRARLVAFGKRDAAVQPPQCREQRGRKIVARRVGRPAERRGRLRDVVGHQPGLGERASQADFVFVLDAGRLQRLREDADRVGMAAALEGRSRARQRRLKGDGDHGREYTTGKIEKIESRSPFPRCACGDFVRRIRLRAACTTSSAKLSRLRASASATHLSHPSTGAAQHRSTRIVALGDSLTAGLGIPREEAYPAVLQRKLQRSGDPARGRQRRRVGRHVRRRIAPRELGARRGCAAADPCARRQRRAARACRRRR